MASEELKDFVRAAFNLRDAANYVIDGEAFGQAELTAALAEFTIADEALAAKFGDIVDAVKRTSERTPSPSGEGTGRDAFGRAAPPRP